VEISQAGCPCHRRDGAGAGIPPRRQACQEAGRGRVHVEHSVVERHGPLPQVLLSLRCRRDGRPVQLVTATAFRPSPMDPPRAKARRRRLWECQEPVP
jgi:hypothetical protein